MKQSRCNTPLASVPIVAGAPRTSILVGTAAGAAGIEGGKTAAATFAPGDKGIDGGTTAVALPIAAAG